MSGRTPPLDYWPAGWPRPPKRKASGPEGGGATIGDLLAAGHLDAARAFWFGTLPGRRREMRGAMLVREALRGMPTPGAVAGSANWALNACVAWALMILVGLLPWDPRPFVLLARYADWCLGDDAGLPRSRGLWSSEVLSAIYGWILHMSATLLLFAKRGPHANRAEVKVMAEAVRQLLETHFHLLDRLTVPALPGDDYPSMVLAPGMRSIPRYHPGEILTSWYWWMRGGNRRRRARGAWANWPLRLARQEPPRVGIEDHGAKLVGLELEITRHGNDYSARLTGQLTGNTVSTMACSQVGGVRYALDLGQRDRAVRVATTARLEDAITGHAPDGWPGGGRIPAPSLRLGRTWHLGADGYHEGSTP